MKKIIMIISILLIITSSSFATDIQLIVDGENITVSSNPVIENDRLMVPIKFVSDKIGANVEWHEEDRTVVITKNNRSIKLWIDSPVFLLDGQYKMSDVAPKIINDRTYVPVKLISNVFNIDVKWHDKERLVIIDSSQSADYEDVYNFNMSLENNAVITSETMISIESAYETEGATLKLLLLDPKTMTGFVVASSENTQAINYLPKVEDKGAKVLVAGIYDSNRNFVAGEVVNISVNVQPVVSVTGADQTVYKNSIVVGQQVNFLPQYVSYKITEVSSGKETVVKKRDPVGTYSYKPTLENNGDYTIQVIAYDGVDNPYYSDVKKVTFDVDKYLNMGGVSNGKTVNKAVSLIASRNFDVTETIFYIKDKSTGVQEILATIPWGSYKWFPDEKYAGEKELSVSVVDTKGQTYTSSPVTVTVDVTPKLLLHGVGPNQILTGDANLSVSSNVAVGDVSYHLSDGTTLGTSPADGSFEYSPTKTANITVYATATYEGQQLTSDSVSLKVYLEKLYSSKPIIEKSKFKSFVSNYAVESFEQTGMAASLQVAQAILETGWGQKLPVDKYNGKFSYNLFGIKGSATNGAVTSNTWEVYNGTSFRVDADFRAYNSIDESWKDHKRILLERSRYEPYRQVMYDSTLGAYAIRRCGYATDPNYPMKLIDIIDMYGLKELDRVGVYLK